MGNDGEVRIGVDVDERGFQSALSRMGNSANQFAGTALRGITTGILAAGTAVTGLGAIGLKMGMDFEASMSQVGATMGLTAEEIRNGSESFNMLEKAAMDAGKSTMFSASQSAEALNYLALAGYDATKAVQALPTVLDLAAAGGLELAYASDLVTDSMAALGLETEELGKFADQLAKTSQKSNTSVGQLGEAILTVGGTAKVLAGGTVELNTALGILADNGIKGAEGGTALRNMILSLTAPTAKAADLMKDIGLEAFDSEGKLRPLNEVFQDLDGILSTMTDEEKTKVLDVIFNKVDLKSANALLANSGERFDELSGYIADADGAAATMAATMQDNLKGSITTLKSALEGLGIQFYKSIDTPAKDVVNTFNGMVGKLTTAMSGMNSEVGSQMEQVSKLMAEGFSVDQIAAVQKGGLEGLVLMLGSILAEMVDKVVQFAPQLIDAGINLIQSFAEGLTNNSDKLISGAETVVTSLFDGIKNLIPSIAPLAADIITFLLTTIVQYQGLLYTAGIDLLAQLLQGIAENIPKITETAVGVVTQIIEGLISNAPLIIEAAISIITQLATGISQALPELLPAVVEVILSIVNSLLDNTGEIIDAAIMLILALANGLVLALPELGQKVPEIVLKILAVIIENAPKLLKAGLELVKMLFEGIASTIGSIFAGIGDLIQKYVFDPISNKIESIIQIGKDIVSGLWEGLKAKFSMVIDGIKDFAGKIASKFKDILGIQSPSKVFMGFGKNIDEGLALGIATSSNKPVEETKKMAVLVGEAAKEAFDASKKWIDEKKNYNELSLGQELQAWKEIQSQYGEGTDQRIEAEKEVYRVKQEINQELQRLDEEYANAVEQRANQIFNAYKLFDGIKDITETTGKELLNNLEEQTVRIEAWKESLAELAGRGIDEGLIAEISKMGPDYLGEIEALLGLSDENLEKYVLLWQEKSALAREQALIEMEGLRLDAITKAEELLYGVDKEFDKSPQIGKAMTDGLANGILGGMSGVINAAVQVARAAIEAANAELGIQSPSKVFMGIGKYLDEGFALGIKQNAGLPVAEMQSLTTDLIGQEMGKLSAGVSYGGNSRVERVQTVNSTSTQQVQLALKGDLNQIAELLYSPLENIKIKRGYSY